MSNTSIKTLDTEQINTTSLHIDTANSKEIVEIINTDFANVYNAVDSQKQSIAKAIDECYNAVINKGRVFYIGAGTSGRLGVLDASEVPPTFSLDNTFIGIIAGGDKALRLSVENAEDDLHKAEQDLKQHKFNSKDVLIGIAASGRTPYVIGALNYANSIKAKTIAIACVQNSIIGNIANIAINLPTQAEVISGSTRLKAGSAQKTTLNIISTAVAIKLGKVYNNLMVDVKASNYKLQQRCINIFVNITNSSHQQAEIYLKQTNYNIKVACLMFFKNIDIHKATDLLQLSNNNLKLALTR